MARRHTPPPQLTEAELAQLRAKLDAMPQNTLEIYYKATHNACRFVMRAVSQAHAGAGDGVEGAEAQAVMTFLRYKENMVIELAATNRKKLIVGVHADEQVRRLKYREPIECYIEGWSDEEVRDAGNWGYLTINRSKYKILSPITATGTFKIQLN